MISNGEPFMKQLRLIVLVLAVAGIVVSFLALREHYRTGTSPCRINERWDCGVVNQSPYAVLGGVPVAALGIAGYALIAALCLRRKTRWLFPAVLIGLGFALYLTYVEAYVLRVWCVFCVGSLTIISLISLLSLILVLQQRRLTKEGAAATTEQNYSTRLQLWAGVAFLFLAILAVLMFRLSERGLSARNQPSSLESFLADRARALSIPVRARMLENPLPSAPALIARGRDHWADHCATCHANNGSGDTEMGRNLYPKVPDMRGRRSQSLTDGDLYYIVRNGIPWTGMPAWGNADLGDLDSETWTLVLFIRQLPRLTPADEAAMEKLNPKSAMEREEEQQEEDFLDGKTQPEKKHEH
jgi:uncharacterized membrane protein/mono/diheme cytochrome c family protein